MQEALKEIAFPKKKNALKVRQTVGVINHFFRFQPRFWREGSPQLGGDSGPLGKGGGERSSRLV